MVNDDENWAAPNGYAWTLGSRLAAQIEGKVVDLRYGVEEIESQQHPLPSFKIVKEEKETALQTAFKAVICSPTSISLWSDSSQLEDGRVGAAIVYRSWNESRWAVKKYGLGSNKETFDTELYRLAKALQIAKKELTTETTEVRVFTDSTAALERVGRQGSGAEQ